MGIEYRVSFNEQVVRPWRDRRLATINWKSDASSPTTYPPGVSAAYLLLTSNFLGFFFSLCTSPRLRASATLSAASLNAAGSGITSSSNTSPPSSTCSSPSSPLSPSFVLLWPCFASSFSPSPPPTPDILPNLTHGPCTPPTPAPTKVPTAVVGIVATVPTSVPTTVPNPAPTAIPIPPPPTLPWNAPELRMRAFLLLPCASISLLYASFRYCSRLAGSFIVSAAERRLDACLEAARAASAFEAASWSLDSGELDD
ncbi:hypothetical protein J1614_009533 [Plenodomus biglobosus]|nr:hypothetical protein J1614_009533 [Plenodomus biglobosus]